MHGAASLAFRRMPCHDGVNVLATAVAVWRDAPPGEALLPVSFVDLLRDYDRITEDGEEVPCGAEEE